MHDDQRQYERHASITSLLRSSLSGQAFGAWADVHDWSAAAPAHTAAAPPLPEEDAEFDVVDWIPASITGVHTGPRRSEWLSPNHGFSALPCPYW